MCLQNLTWLQPCRHLGPHKFPGLRTAHGWGETGNEQVSSPESSLPPVGSEGPHTDRTATQRTDWIINLMFCKESRKFLDEFTVSLGISVLRLRRFLRMYYTFRERTRQVWHMPTHRLSNFHRLLGSKSYSRIQSSLGSRLISEAQKLLNQNTGMKTQSLHENCTLINISPTFKMWW